MLFVLNASLLLFLKNFILATCKAFSTKKKIMQGRKKNPIQILELDKLVLAIQVPFLSDKK